jgi:heme-degrading monooxygenase HmoA
MGGVTSLSKYAVIFRAEILQLDAEYAATAQRMRDLAISAYGCVEFTACTEGNREIAISYWETLEQIRRWKQNAEHLAAQEKGRSRWYRSYTVDVVEVVRAYPST